MTFADTYKYIVESKNQNITHMTPAAPRHEHCTLNVRFSNNVSTSEPLIRELSELVNEV